MLVTKLRKVLNLMSKQFLLLSQGNNKKKKNLITISKKTIYV